MKAIFAALIVVFTVSHSLAQQVQPEKAVEILSNGVVLSAVDVSISPIMDQFGMMTDVVRTHEVFVILEGKIYVCYLIGRPLARIGSRPECYGS